MILVVRGLRTFCVNLWRPEDDGEGRTLIEEAWMIDYYPPLKHTMIKSPVVRWSMD